MAVPSGRNTVPRDFDIEALFDALDRQRRSRGLTWHGVAEELWNQSAILNVQRDDHPIATTTLTGMVKRMDISCQHALFSFIPGSTADPEKTALPVAGPDRRLRWDLKKTHVAIDTARRARNLTWPQLADALHCTPSQLTGIRTARFAIGMRLAMRIVVWLDRPASDFVYAAKW